MRKLAPLLALAALLAGCAPLTPPQAASTPAPDPPVASTAPADPAGIPAVAWSRPLGEPFPEAARPADVGYPLVDDGPFQGLPLGGMGSGSIGRTFRGDFARWHTEVGEHRYAPAWADQFSVYVEQGDTRQAHVLYAGEQPPKLLDWGWGYPVGAGTYHALFPRAWYDYTWDALPVRLTQEQLSPVIPGNYRESSFPAAAFIWRAENPSDQPATVSIMFTWENFLGRDPTSNVLGNINAARREGDLVGIEMSREGGREGDPGDGTIALIAREAPGVRVSSVSRFPVDGSGKALWDDFAADGVLADTDDRRPSGGNPVAAALAVTFTLGPGETRELPFALAWDQPLVRFPSDTSWYKRYTRFFGRDGDNAWQIATETINSYAAWREQIMAWQQPILADPARPDWYKTALFNELYYLVDGGTLWGDPADSDPATLTDDDMGGFAYLECFDYPYYATHDVAFYSSWALLRLWPLIERDEMLAFAATVDDDDPRQVRIGATGATAPRKLPGALPHDLGAPTEDPLVQANAYTWQDINIWKDLNLKYVLRAYRDYTVLGDRALLDELWPTVPVALDYVKAFDRDGDGLLDHEGADQTYDTWTMEGAGAYTGGLLIAALEAGVKMAEAQGDAGRAAEWRAWADKARASFEAKLWNGQYYDYDSGANPNHDSVMADQLAGQWYAGALGLPDVAPKEQIRSALGTVYRLNVMGFEGGAMGAVNGMRPDGSVDQTDMQSREVWSGVTYGLAALMLQEGMAEEAWKTAWGPYNVTYKTHGLWFRTPEAWYADGTYRASMYMRPQSIWAIEHALGLGR